jgi:hypothetical protein
VVVYRSGMGPVGCLFVPLFGIGAMSSRIKGGMCQDCGARYDKRNVLELLPKPKFTGAKRVAVSLPAAPPGSPMLCIACGRSLISNARFCSACGHPVDNLFKDASVVDATEPIPHDAVPAHATTHSAKQQVPLSSNLGIDSRTTPSKHAGLSAGARIAIAMVGVVLVLGLAGILLLVGTLKQAVDGGNHRATWNEREAASLVGPEWWWELNGESSASLYTLGLQHIRKARQNVGAFTILQVVNIGISVVKARAASGQSKTQTAMSAKPQRPQSASAGEQTDVSEKIHPSDLVQSFTIVDANLGLVINRDVWDSQSTQDKKMFFNRIHPIWENIYRKHNPDSTETPGLMLFDLNQDLVTTYDTFMLCADFHSNC